MSGVIVKDMTMPESCAECPLAMLNHYRERYCFVTESIVDIDPFYGRKDNCPMTEIE